MDSTHTDYNNHEINYEAAQNGGQRICCLSYYLGAKLKIMGLTPI